jgi:folate-binding protein YgfZ
MSLKLTLDALYRAEGTPFVDDLGFELPESFGDSLREQEYVRKAAGVFDRTYRGVLDLSGKGLPKFLDGIFSNAINRLSPGQGQLSTLLSSKGKLLGAFDLYSLINEDFRMVLREPIRDELIQAVNRYAFLSDISVTDRSSEIGILSVEGKEAARVLEQVSGQQSLPSKAFEFCDVKVGGHAATLASAGETPEGGFELWVLRDRLEAVWHCLREATVAVGGGPVGYRAAEALRVEAGVARYGKDYCEENFPNEVGLEHALTYDKCYVGQEIVARMRTYGHSNRRIEGLLIPDDSVQSPDGGVFKVDGEDAGTVSTVARSARLGHVVALVLLKRKFWEVKTGLLDTPGGPVEAKIEKLPFVATR